MNITLGFSTCPNDTFIFDAMIHQRIDTEGLIFDVQLADVQQLNEWAFQSELAVTKLSYHALGHVLGNYALLDAGSALGRGCGPLLIAKNTDKYYHIKNNNIEKIAIPGIHTTAYFLLRCAFPDLPLEKAEPYLFSEIEQAILDEKVDAGLIIHENRFTYEQLGLVKLIDLGQWWEETTELPIPLGGIAVNRRLPLDLQRKIQRVMRRSIDYAFKNPEAVMPYVREHAQAMQDEVMKQHIALYVNDFTLHLGEAGRAAIEHLFAIAQEKKIIPSISQSIWVE